MLLMQCLVLQGVSNMSQKGSHNVFPTCFIPYRIFLAILKNRIVVINFNVLLTQHLSTL